MLRAETRAEFDEWTAGLAAWLDGLGMRRASARLPPGASPTLAEASLREGSARPTPGLVASRCSLVDDASIGASTADGEGGGAGDGAGGGAGGDAGGGVGGGAGAGAGDPAPRTLSFAEGEEAMTRI